MRMFLAAALMFASAAVAQTAPVQRADPHLWLEDVTGEKALDWVRAQNAKYLPELEGTPGFAGWRSRAEEILQDPRRIALPTGASPTAVSRTQVFNFWRDANNPRGLWRVSPRAAYDAGTPQWTTVLDMDKLESAERANLQFADANCLAPAWRRCLVSLSVGGKDAVELREFDLKTRRFVQSGFRLPEAKQRIAWLDADRVLVATAAGPATASGYAREVRLWQRGTPYSAATLLLRAAETDVFASPQAYGQAEGRRTVIQHRLTFWNTRIHHLTADFSLQLSPLPEDADFLFIASTGQGPRSFALLQTDFAGIPKGSLVSYAVPNAGPLGKVEAVFTPSQTQAIASVRATGKAIYIALLDNVAAMLLRLERSADAWARHEVPLPANASLGLVAADEGDTLYATVTGFTEPSRLVRVSGNGQPVPLATAPAFFDGGRFEVSQRFATSKLKFLSVT